MWKVFQFDGSKWGVVFVIRKVRFERSEFWRLKQSKAVDLSILRLQTKHWGHIESWSFWRQCLWFFEEKRFKVEMKFLHIMDIAEQTDEHSCNYSKGKGVLRVLLPMSWAHCSFCIMSLLRMRDGVSCMLNYFDFLLVRGCGLFRNKTYAPPILCGLRFRCYNVTLSMVKFRPWLWKIGRLHSLQ